MEYQEIVYKYKKGTRTNIILIFNNKKFHGYSMLEYLESNDFKEFVPGIYIKRKMKYKRKFNEITKSDMKFNLLNTLKIMYCFIYDLLFFKKQDIELIFKIENKRDAIQLFINDKLLYSQSKPIIDNLAYKYNESLKIISNSEYEKEYKWVDTNKILYPFSSGGAGERCAIKGIFYHLGMLDHSSYFDEYTFFTEHEMFLGSSHISSLMDICRNFEHCTNIYNKFLNNTYIYHTPEDWINDITLIESNGIYKISNANHRVCLAKRFGIEKLYAEVIKINTIDKFSNYSYTSECRNNEKILNSFYKKLKNLNLGVKEGKYILKKGLRGKELIEYIEKTTGKTIHQLYKELDKPYSYT